MAGTDSTRRPPKTDAIGEDGPAIVLVNPQLGVNIGMVARAMLNNGLTDLRLVKPRKGWPQEEATKSASGATLVLDNARVFETTEEAVADLNYLYATTARDRDMTKPVVTPKQMAVEMRSKIPDGLKCGVLFGPEASGLTNEDIALADAIVNVPLYPAFSSLNLAQAVLLIGYEWYQMGVEVDPSVFAIRSDTRPATKEELTRMFEHLESELDHCGLFRLKDKRPSMVRNLRTMFTRAQLTEQEVRAMRGIITCLVDGPRLKKPVPK